ncbi:DUF4381 family protein [Luteimonas sp. BDR2-5]|uniref:DUF4381 family protein n=1 Tax=Proluteimonas luteida TaxID=2878685 RepID=UPI001E523A4D|nr:DUF4381 family protein [Luteimonas sp. BDR2-5]MCD9027000.1 DUF4381 family protein [Luteimonas sp. BDR2-5]
MQAPDLVLRDIHQPPPPSWWPPAPGWWLLAAVLLLAAIAIGVLAWRRRRQLRRYRDLFDAQLAGIDDPAARLAAMSALLRRASRRADPQADRLQGDDWLRFLDRGMRPPVFEHGIGAALRDGPFRRDAGDVDVAAVEAAARSRFAALMAGRR